ncbi:PGG domain containing protein [Trema orientale]|uniref:PGG domain containing protein n=1 Tax=Trema orientale TaxID=63057 RepID=A0A2P5E063_TREOI|nr:PGG domain containing protein [Trema orientale]
MALEHSRLAKPIPQTLAHSRSFDKFPNSKTFHYMASLFLEASNTNQLIPTVQCHPEVKKIVQPLYIKAKNKKGKNPEELFSAEHKILLRNGELWMKSTANSCMLVATLIATVVFAAAFSLPGGNNDEGTPNNLQSTSFLIFVLSDGLALLNSIVAVLMFLSILISRYTEHGFLKWLPLKLMIGLTSLFFSMITTMIAFCFTFIIAYHSGLKWFNVLFWDYISAKSTDVVLEK